MDDEIMIGEITCQMLEFLGYEAMHVMDGKAAIKVYKQHMEQGTAFAAVIMDLTIPGGMGGREAVGEILAIDPQARILVSSGYSNDPIMTNFSDYGFCGLIEKPFDMNTIKKAIEAAL
jgi:DNA-binding NtrC family response regulator